MTWMDDKNIFHIHTFRCGHAEDIKDAEYIKRAVELGASDIWFTDHAPFPDNPFKNRMQRDELETYISSLFVLKHEYAGAIDVHIGLEIEYFPFFDRKGYYKELRDDPRIEMLLLGQHMAEIQAGSYTFSWNKAKLEEDEYRALGDSICQGILSGYFDAVAHPDRIFRRRKCWDSNMADTSYRIIKASMQREIPLELNMHSVAYKNQYWPEFWQLISPKTKTIVGLDAHSVDEMERRYHRKCTWKQNIFAEGNNERNP